MLPNKGLFGILRGTGKLDGICECIGGRNYHVGGSGLVFGKCVIGLRRIASLARVATHQMVTREYENEYAPKNLKRLKLFATPPPNEVVSTFHDKLNGAYSNPRSILKIYKQYIVLDDRPNFNWLVRCFYQLSNTFGFNSFWSERDKQTIQGIKYFKYLIYDLIESRASITPTHVPKLLYSMACVQYRVAHVLPEIFSILENNIENYTSSCLCNMALTLSLLGLGGCEGGPMAGEGIVEKIALHLMHKHQMGHLTGGEGKEKEINWGKKPNSEKDNEVSHFHWAALAYAIVISNLYHLGEGYLLASILSKAVSGLTLEALNASGWVQYYVYLSLYCVDVEKPLNEVLIKKAVPFPMQQTLHARWLEHILLHGQPSGSDMLQQEVDSILKDVQWDNKEEVNYLINCSVGRPDDEQHCLFASHLIPHKNLTILYDTLKPLHQPTAKGEIKLKKRIFNKLNYHVAIIHKCVWDGLSVEEKTGEVHRILNSFEDVSTREEKFGSRSYAEDAHYVNLKHKRRTYETWPPEKFTI